jgi:hypothetical protein
LFYCVVAPPPSLVDFEPESVPAVRLARHA